MRKIGSSRDVSGSHQLVMTSYRYPEVRRGLSGLFFFRQTPAMRRGIAVNGYPGAKCRASHTLIAAAYINHGQHWAIARTR